MVLHALLERASKTPYRIKDGGRGVIVWQVEAGGIWKEVATFRSRDDAEAFVFVMSGPVLGEWR